MRQLKLLLPLLAFAYLGFYVYGVIIGVFSPLELIGFTIIAVVLTIGSALLAIALRRGWTKLDEPTPAQARAIRARRERRGF